MKIHISEDTQTLLSTFPDYITMVKGKTEVKVTHAEYLEIVYSISNKEQKRSLKLLMHNNFLLAESDPDFC